MTGKTLKRSPTGTGIEMPDLPSDRPITGATPCRFLTKPQVLDLLGCAATTLFVLTHKAGFPKARVLYVNAASTSGRSYYLADEVEAWMRGRPVRVLKAKQTNGGQA